MQPQPYMNFDAYYFIVDSSSDDNDNQHDDVRYSKAADGNQDK